MRVVTLGALVLIAGGAFFIGTRYAENIDQHEASEPRASTQAAPLSRTRVANCQTMRLNARDWGIKEQDDYRHNCWERFEAENGAVYRLDLGLIQSFAAGATSVVYTDEVGRSTS